MFLIVPSHMNLEWINVTLSFIFEVFNYLTLRKFLYLSFDGEAFLSVFGRTVKFGANYWKNQKYEK